MLKKNAHENIMKLPSKLAYFPAQSKTVGTVNSCFKIDLKLQMYSQYSVVVKVIQQYQIMVQQ